MNEYLGISDRPRSCQVLLGILPNQLGSPLLTASGAMRLQGLDGTTQTLRTAGSIEYSFEIPLQVSWVDRSWLVVNDRQEVQGVVGGRDPVRPAATRLPNFHVSERVHRASIP